MSKENSITTFSYLENQNLPAPVSYWRICFHIESPFTEFAFVFMQQYIGIDSWFYDWPVT